MPLNTTEYSTPPGTTRGPTLFCRSLAEFDAADLESVRDAFESAATCSLHQAWQATPSKRFAPAVVRSGWRDHTLWVYAELTDEDIHTRASGLNQHIWELGDAFEIFLRPEAQQAYVEFQVAPNNQRLQLCYSSRAALDRTRETGSTEDVLIHGEAFCSHTWIAPECSRWYVLAGIPALSVLGSDTPLEGTHWRFSFSRYDYTRDREDPVISSTSPHPEADFHRLDDWGVILFVSSNDQGSTS